MNEIVTVRTADVIAAEINAIKRGTAQYLLMQSLEIGRLLVEAKGTVAHGEWGKWLGENCAYSTSNANNLMRLYTEYGESEQVSFFEENKLELFGNLNRSQAIALLAVPRSERADFVREHDVQSMSVSELEEAIRKAKAEGRAEAEAESEGLEESVRETVRVQVEAEMEKRIREAEESAESARSAASRAESKLKAKEQELKSRESDVKRLDENNETLRQKYETERLAKEERDGQIEKLKADMDDLSAQLEAAEKPAEISPEEREQIAIFARAEADAEINSLKAQLEKAKIAANPVVMRFQAEFERFGESFNKMKKLIDECGDAECAAKLSGALAKTLERMAG